jgi:Ca-activated chloride channel family protein
VAEETGGSFHEAASGEELRQVYEDIGSSVGYRNERQEISARFIGLALIVAAAAALASLAWFARLP